LASIFAAKNVQKWKDKKNDGWLGCHQKLTSFLLFSKFAWGNGIEWKIRVKGDSSRNLLLGE